MTNLSDNSSDLCVLDKERWSHDVVIVVYLIVMMLFGTVGNAFVFYIYYCKLDKTASNLFVAALSCCDLFCCFVCVPLDIVIILHPYTFYNDAGCRITRFLIMNGIVTSAVIVCAISVDRFKKVVLPLHKQMTRIEVGQICVAIVIISIAVSLPCFYVYATQEVTTHRLNLTGMECTLSSKINHSLVYQLFLIIICILVLMAVSTIYCIIGIKLCRYTNEKQSFINSLHRISSKIELHSMPNSCIQEQQQLDTTSTSKKNSCPYDTRPRRQSLIFTSNHISINTTRTTLIMFLISFFWTVGFLPHLAANILLAMNPNLKQTLGHTGHTILRIGLRSFYFNHAANPWIYSIFNYRFQHEFVLLMRRAACR